MSKTIIEVKCVDQVMTFVNTPVIASGGLGEDYVSFEFCEKWDGYTVTALFWRQGVDPIPVLADAENLYQVPPELMTSEGVVYFGVAGVSADGARRTSEAISYRIQAGAITENTTLPDPDGDVFTQLLAQYADVKLYVSSRVSQAAESASAAQEAAENVQNLLETGGYIKSNEKGAASGVASLDGSGKVPYSQLPSMNFIPTSQKGVAGGVATLDSEGKVKSSQLPDIGNMNIKVVEYTGTGSTSHNIFFEEGFSPKVIFLQTNLGCATCVLRPDTFAIKTVATFQADQSVTPSGNTAYCIPLTCEPNGYTVNISTDTEDPKYAFNASDTLYVAIGIS